MYDPNLNRLAQAQTRERLAASAEAHERELTWERGPRLGERLLAALRKLAGARVAPRHRQEERSAAWERM